MAKEQYTRAELEFSEFEIEDVITSSGDFEYDDNETEILP